jgi:hypothetical protein
MQGTVLQVPLPEDNQEHLQIYFILFYFILFLETGFHFVDLSGIKTHAYQVLGL